MRAMSSNRAIAGASRWDAGFARRLRLLRGKAPAGERGPDAKLLWGELATFAEPLLRPFREPMDVAVAEHPRVVMLLPGFGTHPMRMRYMARQLERAGHKVKRWGLGFNLGPTQQNFDKLARRVEQVSARYGQNVVLVGWSLGGIFAREIAKRHPEHVAKVISMGSPFSGTPYANNAWRIYQLVTGHSVEQPPVEAELAVKPPVETIALWSPRDGVISPRSACGHPGERDRAIAIRCTHLGFSNSHEAIGTILRELEEF
ncbi:pimeloyl-ACP methyl ester carboxylesterase [Altererythrobacter atlanticus]|uniref:Alpha/beta hydrolase family protein n=1 Tax=Croceibacterium atlanticum TaxID=1267766 RepID=A0A0F7KV95_9SPHN|nr:alpha/beta fold hydrolase [Croceibacterium atlanticum]AKH44263.1 Alpha/beta hydrolase family protein [Croceibacterium atlanticum]MBB5732574.1 pimeloyl-ACP methyl ester carboxylesterase [Croceibacterium atlanticum]